MTIDEIYQQLQSDPARTQKYQCAGIYSISIDGLLVYIGKSHNMLHRLAEHIHAIQHSPANKYKVLRVARASGYAISFDVLAYAKQKGRKEFSQLGYMEGYYIRKYLPPLNYQIPQKKDFTKYTVNPRAQTITLSEILKEKHNG